MTATELIAEITECFLSEPYPGDLNIVVNNAPDYDLESLRIRDTFKLHTWQTLPDELMQYEYSGHILLSNEGLKYYLPAYLQFVVRNYNEAGSIADSLIFVFTLPADVDIALSIIIDVRYQIITDAPMPDWKADLQNRLQDSNESAHWFIDRNSQFNAAQGRAIYHFLCFMRDEHGADYWGNEPQIAIERYWFQFA